MFTDKQRQQGEGLAKGPTRAPEEEAIRLPKGEVRATETATGTVLEKGLRFNQGKRKWSYVNFKSLEPMVEVLEFGAKKYAPFNWQKGLKKDEILESMLRHVVAMIDGETVDKESGISHIGHVMCNAMFYSYFEQNKEDFHQKS